MLSLILDLSMRLRITSSFVANASVGANGHLFQWDARATMEALFLRSKQFVSPEPPFKD